MWETTNSNLPGPMKLSSKSTAGVCLAFYPFTTLSIILSKNAGPKPFSWSQNWHNFLTIFHPVFLCRAMFLSTHGAALITFNFEMSSQRQVKNCILLGKRWISPHEDLLLLDLDERERERERKIVKTCYKCSQITKTKKPEMTNFSLQVNCQIQWQNKTATHHHQLRCQSNQSLGRQAPL